MAAPAQPPVPWRDATLLLGLAGSLLLWAALPPLALGWLAWCAPVPWLWLVRAECLPGRRPYGALYLAGLAFWLALLQWLRLPHPALYLGWIALAVYLAAYLPLFVGLSRVAVHGWHVPLWLAAPVVWTGLELVRAHLFTGFMLGSIAHTQAHWAELLQISSLVGEYGVTFLIVAISATVANALPLRLAAEERAAVSSPELAGAQRVGLVARLAPLGLAVAALGATLAYGRWQLDPSSPSAAAEPPRRVRIALIQGNSLAKWKQDPAREGQIMEEYISLSEEAIAQAGRAADNRPIDLIVWPETMFRTGLRTFEASFEVPPGSNYSLEEITAAGPRQLAHLVARLGVPVLVGIDRVHFLASPPATSQNRASTASPPRYRAYNSAVLVDRAGRIVGSYDKQHRVVFGEYIPFADWLPGLYDLTPLTGGIEAGREAVSLELDGVRYAPNICYESVIPHVIRRQVAALTERGERPDVLVNVTNDAWYWGSSVLDLHLACGVFRAVEAGTPLVVAANGGLSASIDRFGRVVAVGPRQQPEVILADVAIDRGTGGTANLAATSFYVAYGDWFAGACLAFCIGLAVDGWRGHRRLRSKAQPL